MTERSNKEIIKGMREIVKPFIGDFLKRENYEGMGDIDKAEFETEFEKVLTLAEKAETLSEILDKISAEIQEKSFTEEIFDEEIFKSTYTENVTRETAEEESVIETEIVKLSDILEIIDKNMKGENNA